MKPPTITPYARVTLATIERAMVLLEAVIENARTVETQLLTENARMRRDLVHWKTMAEEFNRENDGLRAELMEKAADVPLDGHCPRHGRWVRLDRSKPRTCPICEEIAGRAP